VSDPAAASGAGRSALDKVAARLRAQRIRTLMSALTIGLAGSTVILLAFPKAWMLGMLLVASTGAALWALVDRALGEVRARPNPGGPVATVYESLRWVAAAIAIIAILEFTLSALHVVLGGGWN
jgi:hypothetical protein